MNTLKSFLLALGLSVPMLGSAQARERTPTPPVITAPVRDDVIQALGRQLREKYIFPDVAEQAITAINAKHTQGAYANATTLEVLVDALTDDLHALTKDSHFQLGFDPGFKANSVEPTPAQRKRDMAGELEFLQSISYGLPRIEWLPGNVGYIELRGFGPTEYVADAYNAAIELMAGSEALIIDLRRNGGGDPGSVAQWMSHFFAVGDERHLNDIYHRHSGQTRQYWTNRAVKARYEKPVYVLTSGRTFSGGEECAYDFQAQERGTVIGEATGGGSNPGSVFALGHDFVVFIPTGRAINPVTQSNWEHTGVQPDIVVPAVEALKAAHVAILRVRIEASAGEGEKQALQQVLAKVESGAAEVPDFGRRH